MRQSQSKNLPMVSSDRIQRLKGMINQVPDFGGELYDAKFMGDIAFQLYDLRKKSGKTQKELAELLHVKQSNISRWEQPGYQGYKLKMLSKIARTLGGKLHVTLVDDDTNYVLLHQETFKVKGRINKHEYTESSSGTWEDKYTDVTFHMEFTKGVAHYENV